MAMYHLVDALLDTTATATAALRQMEGQPFTAADYITRWQDADDVACGRRRAPIRVTAYTMRAVAG